MLITISFSIYTFVAAGKSVEHYKAPREVKIHVKTVKIKTRKEPCTRYLLKRTETLKQKETN